MVIGPIEPYSQLSIRIAWTNMDWAWAISNKMWGPEQVMEDACFFFQESASTHPTRIQIRELSPKNKFYHNLLEASGEKNNSRPKDLLKENMHTTTTQLLHCQLNISSIQA